ARRVERLCGKAFYAQALHIDYSLDGLRLWGWLGRPEAARSQADLQYAYVNGRSVRDKLINHALRQAQGDLYPGRHPAWLLYMELDPLKVDVNVHPTKHEVRFHQARQVHDFLVHAVSEALADKASAVAPPPSAPRRDFYTPAEGNIPADWSVREAPRAEAPAANTDDETRPDQPILATLAGGYLLVEEAGALLLINAPAVRAAQLAASFTAGETQTARPLLIPETVELSVPALQWLEQHSEWLARQGIDLSAVSDTELLLRQVPAAAAASEPGQWLPAFVRAALAGTAPEQALARALSCPPHWSAAEQQALVRDALAWQPEPQPARYWVRWDQAALQALFET
ncbi:MAG: hypothetical protein SV201_12785, partial [Pseudomonadota bacterium]|nr:hypothetical protein [Pseudomonadota bacterium]